LAQAASNPVASLFDALRVLRDSRRADERMAHDNPYLMQALEEEKREGLRIAIMARTAALVAIAILLPLINPTFSVLYYEALLLVFMGLGWLQLRVGRVGQSRAELALILADLLLLTLTILLPNPLLTTEFPTALQYRFENFLYFFIILAAGTLAYSWRTVLTIGTWTAMLWLAGAVIVQFFGRRMQEFETALHLVLPDDPIVAAYIRGFLDPNAVMWNVRSQEIVVFLIVAGILALRGRRSNQLLIRQAGIAHERANLSRYFPPNLVDALATRDHGIGAERSQEVAVLFADIVGFTKIAERTSPRKVMELLRRYHAVIENVIFAHGGTLDKYLGDGVMATFGTPSAGPHDATNALAAARRIVAEMDHCSAECVARGDPDIRVSVGVHFGTVMLGDIGPSRRLEFAVIGDTVNVAARLEAATRELDCRIVASEALLARLREEQHDEAGLSDGLTAMRALHLRGRDAPIDVWVA